MKAKLYLEFYKSTIVLGLTSSLVFSLFIHMALSYLPDPPPLIVIYIRCFMFGAPLICFYEKEISRKNEYYFYYNKGISKINLLASIAIVNILTGILALITLYYAKLT